MESPDRASSTGSPIRPSARAPRRRSTGSSASGCASTSGETAGDAPPLPPAEHGPPTRIFPDGLFDFREMRIVDNEMPYIIFTDKEFRVIHGLAVVYLWLIDLDAIFCATLEALGVDPALVEEYRKFVAEGAPREPPHDPGAGRWTPGELSAHIHEKLQYEDYLDLFENVYRWFESTRGRLGAG